MKLADNVGQWPPMADKVRQCRVNLLKRTHSAQKKEKKKRLQSEEARYTLVLHQARKGLGIDLGDFAHKAQILIGYACFQHTSIRAAQPQGFASQVVQRRHQLCINKACEDCGDDFEALGVRDP